MSTTSHDSDDDDPKAVALLHRAKRTALAPVGIAISRPARRAYLTTILLSLAASVLFGAAVVA